MERYSGFMKETRDREKDYFFGDRRMVTSKYFTFEHVKDDDNIIVVTDAVKMLRNGSIILIVGNDQAVYLKEWQIWKVTGYYGGFDGWAVKLRREFYKPYRFNKPFPGVSFRKPDTFDNLKATARAQNCDPVRAQGTSAGINWLVNSKYDD